LAKAVLVLSSLADGKDARKKHVRLEQEKCAKTAKMKQNELECGPMPNLMVALPNIGGAFCSTPQSLADAHY